MKTLSNVTKLVAVTVLVSAAQASAMSTVKAVGVYADKAAAFVPNAVCYAVENTVGRIPTVKGNSDKRVKLADLYAYLKRSAFEYVFGDIKYVKGKKAETDVDGEVTTPAVSAKVGVQKDGVVVFQQIHAFFVLHKTTAKVLKFAKNLGLSAAVLAGVYAAGKAIYNTVAPKVEEVVIDPVLEDAQPEDDEQEARRKAELNA